MLPDIDSLALFVHAAELRSLTKAAEASHIGLGAASRRIALLEHRLKVTLFERTPRGVDLTPAGAAMLVHAKDMLRRMNEMLAEMGDHASGRKGALRILASTSAMTQFLPDDLASYSALHPEVRLLIEERWSGEIVQETLAGQADIGIVVEGIATDNLDVLPYRTDRIAAVVPAGHALATAADMRFVDVLAHDIVALESGSSMMRLLAERAVVSERTLQLRIQVRSFEAVCRMVLAGRGVGLLPYQAAVALGRGMGLVVRPLPEEWAERRMLLCVRRDRPAGGPLASLIQHLTAIGLAQPCEPG